ncbi:4-hydroxythreonine-4-phosphate dehydrogenase PdxA [bacterium]|nr:4-hydroxythreonine-4-phosphate dehydrogenase PdxA [bacterium]
MKKIAITFGDPNGISPEITIKALNFLDLSKDKVILVTNKKILDYYKDKFDLALEKEYEIAEVPFDIEDIQIGKETEAGGEFSFCALRKASDLAMKGEIQAIVTAPVSKNAMHMAGHNYSGQTEVIEQYLANTNQKADMLFICDKYSVLLLTRHIPLKDVPVYITKEFIVDKVQRLVNSLKSQLGKENPSIAICALNPHAGENGVLGDEELEHIIPAVEYLQTQGIDISGPFPSDTLFTTCVDDENRYDCYIAMYHDQGLIPVKLLEKSNCVNTTIGLDVIRTSPAHGTAYNIAGKNAANPNSMISAIELALK